MTMLFRPAARQDSKPLIGFYARSGCGKTMSALLLARGLVGPKGKIAMIDTESGRGSLYADVIPGGYDVMELGEPFSPARYIEAIDAAVKSGASVLVIDSASHEWEGAGGVVEMAGEIERRTGKSGLHCWKDPKMAHTRFMLKLLQSPIPVIVCLRAKRKSRQVKDEKGKTAIVKDEYATPKQDGDFIFEMTVHAEIMDDHTLRVTKVSHPALASIFKTGVTVTVQTGEALAAWARGGTAKQNTQERSGTAREAPSAGNGSSEASSGVGAKRRPDAPQDGPQDAAQPTPDGPAEEEPTDPLVIAAESWANEKIAWLRTARIEQVDTALDKWSGRLKEINELAPDISMAVVAAAEMRKKGLVVAGEKA